MFSLSPLIFSETIEPPSGIPRAFIEHLSVEFAFSNHVVQDLNSISSAEQQLLRPTFLDHEKNTQQLCETSRFFSGSTQPGFDNKFFELFQDPQESQDVGFVRDEMYNLSSREEDLFDFIPDGQSPGLEASCTSLVPNSREVDPKQILALADVGLQSLFCGIETEKSTDVHLSSKAIGPKLFQISPVLFSPGYSQVRYRGPSYNVCSTITE